MVYSKRSFDDFRENAIKRMKTASSLDDECELIKEEFTNSFFNPPVGNLHTLHTRCGELKKEIKKNFPNDICRMIEKEILPKMPLKYIKKRSEQYTHNINNKINNPIVINADKLIRLALCALEEAIESKVYPEVVFIMNHLVASRANDFNIGHVRINNTVASQKTCQYIQHAEIIGTIAILEHSKKKENVFPNFATITIVHPKFYPLIKKALDFLLDSSNATISCYTGKKKYLTRVPCGPVSDKNKEWSELRPVMIKRLRFEEAIDNWNGHPKIFNFGRSFVASCIQEKIIELDKDLVGVRAVELALGHLQGSNATRSYLRLRVDPVQLPGIILKKVKQPIEVNGKLVTSGVYISRK